MTENTRSQTTEKINITIPNDNSVVYMTVYPPTFGEAAPTIDDCMKALALKGVNHNINVELIQAIIQKKQYDREFRVASADRPIDGKNGTITYLYEKEVARAPKENEAGFVDYKDLGLIRNIHEGDIIAEITPPDDGVDGVNVRGIVMKAIPGKKAQFSLGTGTKLSEDGKTIYAAINGHISYKGNSFCVEPSVSIRGNVDASVGNLDFLGDIVINGDVMEGFLINAGKNVTIKGSVMGGTIKAGGSVIINKGCINSTVVAHGDIKCQFCEHSSISSDSNITVQNFLVCTVYCGESLTSKALSGGKYTILGDADIHTLGTKNYVPTELILGDNAMLVTEKENAQKSISELDSQIDRATQIVEFLNEKRKLLKGGLPADKEELLGSMIKARLTAQMQKKEHKKRIAEIEEALIGKEYRTVVCKDAVYPEVRVTINDASIKIDKEIYRAKIYQNDEGEIICGKI